MSNSRLSRICSCLLLLLAVCPVFALDMVRVAAIPGYYGSYAPCGDCNHNRLADIVGTYGRPAAHAETLRFAEHMEGDSFQESRTRLRTGSVLDVGDGDRDGLSDIITRLGGESLCVFEAAAPDSFPSRLVWTSTDFTIGSLLYARFCDLDRDSEQEIVTCGTYSDGIQVFENRGDDQYTQVPFPHPSYSDVNSDFGVGDFDGDGRTEVVGGGGLGELHVFECTGDDQYVQVCSLEYSPNEIESYHTAAAEHMDLDGRPGFINMRRVFNVPSDSGRVRVYEEPVHNQFVCVCSMDCRYALWSGQCVAAGDVDGDGVWEIAVSNGIDVRLFKCVALHTWEQVWQWDHGSIPWIRFYDINQDSRIEMIISAESTYIWEDTSGLGTAEIPKPPPWVRSIAVEPTVSRRGWPAIFTGIPDGATVAVHDMAGRLVRTQLLQSGPSWTWNLRDQSGNLVPAGTYFAVIRSRRKSTSLKLCVVK